MHPYKKHLDATKMPGPNLITVLRGLKVRVSTPDAFLRANGKPHGTDGSSFILR